MSFFTFRYACEVFLIDHSLRMALSDVGNRQNYCSTGEHFGLAVSPGIAPGCQGLLFSFS